MGSLLERYGPDVGLLEAAKRGHVEDMWDMGACNAQRSGEVARYTHFDPKIMIFGGSRPSRGNEPVVPQTPPQIPESRS